jgi:MFS family permease
MELDELKNQLKNKLASDHAGRSDGDIALLLGKRTSSIIDKLKRSLKKEIFWSIIILIGFVCVSIFINYQSVRIYFSVFAVLCIPFIFVLLHLLRRTTRLSSTALPVKKNLQEIVTITEDFVKRYFQFSMALLPVCFIFSFLLGYNEPKPIPGVDRLATKLFSGRWEVIVFFMVYFIGLSVGVYYFTKWYLRKLYGKYIIQLKECISELSEE